MEVIRSNSCTRSWHSAYQSDATKAPILESVEASSAVGAVDAPFWKRVLDLLVILVALPVGLPLMLLIALYIKVVSPGPVFFKQERIGLRGKRFLCLKFRSMKYKADTGVHQNHLKDLIASGKPMVKMDQFGDSRLIPFGAWLRSSGLDELPQLINVLYGEMSMVGPRPCTPFEAEQYSPWHHERFSTLPGLTGLWQVSGKNKTTFEEMIRLDIQYARTKSPWMDLSIMARTFGVLVGQVNEARQSRKAAK